MTKREFFNAILETEAITKEIREYAEVGIKKLDDVNAHKSSQPTKTQKENEAFKIKVLEVLESEVLTASEVGAKLEVTTQKASALCRQLEEAGKLTREKVKSGKSKVFAYRLADAVPKASVEVEEI